MSKREANMPPAALAVSSAKLLMQLSVSGAKKINQVMRRETTTLQLELQDKDVPDISAELVRRPLGYP